MQPARRGSASPRGLYVHIPFCSGKCFYCDFVSFAGRGAAVGRYLDALGAEARRHASFRPDTLYIGGGTPTELSAAELERLLAIVRGAFPSAGSLEATCEANPESLTADKLRVLRAGGVGRLSLGLQTGSDRLLAAIGRRHTHADSVAACRAARAAGFVLSVDLMFGLPGQTRAGLARDLEAVLALGPEHLSLYGLEEHESAAFRRMGAPCGEDLAADMFEDSLERLAAAGFHHYEVSNFALPGRECLHNGIYWTGGEYLGLGCAAASFVGGERRSNVPDLEEYCSRALAGTSPVACAERLEGRERLGEEIILGLRLMDGFEPRPEARKAFAPELRSLAARGLLSLEGRRVRLTRRGLLLANVAASEFVPPFDARPRTGRRKEALA